MTELQDRPVIIGTPIEIEKAVNEIRISLAELPWISNPYFIAQKFYTVVGKKSFIYPETYAPQAVGSRDYHKLTPDNDYKGMFFFMVGRGVNNVEELLTYPVSVIFSVNLELIDTAKLNNGLFTQELISEARKLLKSMEYNSVDFRCRFVSETRDLRETYREFQLDVLEQYNRAPLQCFRFELELTVSEDC